MQLELSTLAGIAFLQIGYIYISVWGTACLFRRRVSEPVSMAGALLVFALTSYTAFWLSWAYPEQQMIFQVGLSLGLICVAVAGCTLGRDHCSLGWPFLVAGAVSTAFFLIVHAGTKTPPLVQAAAFFSIGLTSDSALPMMFADAILNGHVPSPLAGDWLASDRPPLQVGMYLLSPGVYLFGSSQIAYQAMGIAVQMFALVGAWMLARAMHASRIASTWAVAALVFTPFLFKNGIYVWPKLLAASFLTSAVVLHFYGERRTIVDGVVVGGCCAMAMLSHGAAMFTLVGMFFAALLLLRIGTLKYIIAAVLSVVLLYAPWTAYQKFVDPPGDRLIRWHFAGTGITAPDTKPLEQSLHDAYQGVTLHKWIDGRLSNAHIAVSKAGFAYSETAKLVWGKLTGIDKDEAYTRIVKVREYQFFNLVLACGILGFGYFALPFGLLFRIHRPVCLIVMLNLGVWWATIYDPKGAVVHVGSYFAEVAIVVGSFVWLVKRWPRFAFVVLAFQIGVTTLQYTVLG